MDHNEGRGVSDGEPDMTARTIAQLAGKMLSQRLELTENPMNKGKCTSRFGVPQINVTGRDGCDGIAVVFLEISKRIARLDKLVAP